MKRQEWMAGLLAVTTALAVQAASADMETRAQLVLDPDGGDEAPVGFLFGIGTSPVDRLALGVYASYVGTDRDLPRKMDKLYGYGAYAEWDLTEGYALMPYIGARAGVLNPDGASFSSVGSLAGVIGLRYDVSPALAFSCSLNVLWCSEDYFDYEKKSVTEWDANNTDVTLDLGVRYRF